MVKMKSLCFLLTCILISLDCRVFGAEPVVILRAVRGRDARLPCGQGKVFLDGPESYILWLRNDLEYLYRFPLENSDKRIALRNHVFGTPCDSGYCHDSTSLLIKKVSDRDAGLYRCRVHYQASPSVDYIIEVRLVESPGLPKLYTGDGSPIIQGYVGPLSLGSDLVLTCEVKDSKSTKVPETEVYWRRNGLVTKRAYVYQPGILRADLHLNNLTRSDLDAHYECLAQNSDVTEPLIAGVVIKMYLPPMSVEIRLNNNYDFEAGQPRVVDCVVIGCVPPPAITWHLGDTMLRPTVHKELHDGNYTVSSLTLAPSLRDDQKKLVCRAHNSHLPSERFVDKVTLNVGYRPVCQMGREERIGAVVREAETVTCIVDASPEPMQFSWTFADSTTLYTGVTKVPGYPHRYSSTLTWLSREGDIGQLHCRATNAFGEQKKPCSFNITIGGPPSLPDCRVSRTYPNALRVQCNKGWDGGRPQSVHLEVLDEDGTPVRNVTDVAGHFFLPDIVYSRNMTAVLYATNSRGKSVDNVIALQSLKPPPASALNNYMTSTWMPYVEALVGTLAFIIAIVSISLGTKVLMARRQSAAMNPDIIPRNDGIFHREPDFIRDERLLGRTNITVNQMAACQNQYSSSPLPACRVLVDCGTHSSSDSCPSSPHSYYV
ncbi:hypothetical protein B5X24_HaOG207406 [Helicoverpa armigera]|uniref:Ig-like domain-containing protein n=1 Tax=Helicoverpa armigera TaxID=29058 RepID=A0A2W1BLS7_HELAM|nr:hypothetical protein B5X24_HaOG207406 [Helicoverpa armigera]